MSGDVPILSVSSLALAAVPVAVVLVLLRSWGLESGAALRASLRMVVQLIAVGYVLTTVFLTESPLVVVAVVGMMTLVSGWISLRPLGARRRAAYPRALLAVACGGLSTLLLATQAVLQVEPWFAPRYMIPLAGMAFAGAMNAVSLAAERFGAELHAGADTSSARTAALRASLIPITNSLVSVGLVSLPGMMTGQILSGVSPLIAVRYQILIMCMLFGSAGIASAVFLATANEAEGKPDSGHTPGGTGGGVPL